MAASGSIQQRFFRHRSFGRFVGLGALIAGAAVFVSACTSYENPELSIAEAREAARTEAGLELRFDIDAKNGNEEPLPLRDVEYALELDGKRVFSGTRSPEATLRRHDTQRFTLPAVVNLADHPGPWSGRTRYKLSGELKYVTPGQLAEVLFDANIRVPSVGFTFEGEVELVPAGTPAAVPSAQAR